MNQDSGGRYDPLPLRSDSLPTALVREIENFIMSGELLPGERINEVQLAMRFGTSRGPVREATRSLEAQGLVEAVRNRGVYIRAITRDEAEEIYDLRCALFGLAARLAALRVTEATAHALREQLNEMDRTIQVRDFKAYLPLNLAFHDHIMAAGGNETLAETYRGQVKKLQLFRPRTKRRSTGFAISNSEHRKIAEAIIAGDAERAHAAAWNHVDRNKRKLLESLAKS
jgi:DNA-binding GntR family transcriptional regulator